VLAENSENLEGTHVIESKTVSASRVAAWRKNAGGKNEGNLHYVIENKWIKNVRFRSFHYIIENKLLIVAFPLY
jgi:hypothetical protein